jgi:predicted phage baseplate assembly protein
MALPAPNLDDRRFQDLVDDAKRLVQQRCPEWTDHNVSDPGVTLIETFAWMTDQLLYRLNRVPDRHYVKFLDLLGVGLFPPTAARAGVTFWLSAPQPDSVRIAAGTQVATPRTEADEAIVFSTLADLAIVPSSLAIAASMTDGQHLTDHTDDLSKGKAFFCFDSPPKPGDALMVGLPEAVPSCAITLRFESTIEGVGVDPDRPPLAWEAFDGTNWAACELDSDGTGGLNRNGDVVLHVPKSHAAAVVDRNRAGWIRARITDPQDDQPQYSASPSVQALTVFTIGGTTEAVNAEAVRDEVLGTADGVPGQRFGLLRVPVVPGDNPLVLRTAEGDATVEWTQVSSFAGSDATEAHFVLDAATGELSLGPGVRLPDGSMRQYGRIPPKGAILQMDTYFTGGGKAGNVAARALSVLKSSIPFVARIENRHAASEGVDGEDIENAKVRGPIVLRTRGRAVTVEDYEQLAREAAPEVARVRAVAATEGADSGSVRVLVVPNATHEDGRLPFERLVPAEETLAKITARLDESRVIGVRVIVEPPVYRGVTIVARLHARPRTNPRRLEEAAIAALYAYFDPIEGGPDGGGWPFGRPVQVGEVFAVLQNVRGVEMVEDVRLFGADPITGKRGDAVQRLELESNALLYSYEHQLQVEAS